MLLVQGIILFDGDGEPVSDATVYVHLEDVSRADAAARVVAAQVIRGVHAGGAIRQMEFAIYGEELEPRTHYGVRVHVDVDNDGAVSAGDYVSTASHPVTADLVPVILTIPVHLV